MAIKNAVQRNASDFEQTEVNATFPVDNEAVTPLSFTDYVTALRAERVCLASGISGINNGGYNWMVPLVKCDSRECEFGGQDAVQFCEYGIIAVAGIDGGEVRAKDFKEWVEKKYPAIGPDGDKNEMPFDHDLIQIFDGGPGEMNDYIAQREYGETGYPKINMGIVFEGNDDDDWKYWLRQNSTNFNAPENEGRPATLTTPDTSVVTDSFARNDQDACFPIGGTPPLGVYQSSCTGQYIYNGVLTFQRLVNDFILDQEAGNTDYRVAEAGVQFVPFPTRRYVQSGFYGTLAGT